MKRLVILTMVMVVLMSVSGQALAGSWVGVLGNYPSCGGGIYGGGIYGGGIYGGGKWNGVLGNSYRYPSYRYPSYRYPSTNVRVKYNESWGLQGGQRSYEQSPDLNGKIIDIVTILGGLAILSR